MGEVTHIQSSALLLCAGPGDFKRSFPVAGEVTLEASSRPLVLSACQDKNLGLVTEVAVKTSPIKTRTHAGLCKGNGVR